MTAKRTVYVVDDEEPIRRSSKLMLMTQNYQVTVFDSGPALLNVWEALVPGCILLDIRMPEMDGLEVQRILNSRGAALPVVVMTGHGDLTIAGAALQNGAVALMEKPFSKAGLNRALHIAFLKLEDPDAYGQHLIAAGDAVKRLSEEDRIVLDGLAEGRSSEAVAGELGIGISDIDVRRARLFAGLGVESLTDALRIAFAARLGRD